MVREFDGVRWRTARAIVYFFPDPKEPARQAKRAAAAAKKIAEERAWRREREDYERRQRMKSPLFVTFGFPPDEDKKP